MIKMTIVTDDHGNVVGAQQHSARAEAKDAPRHGGSFGPGTRTHDVEVPDDLDMTKVKDVRAFTDGLKRHVPKQ